MTKISFLEMVGNVHDNEIDEKIYEIKKIAIEGMVGIIRDTMRALVELPCEDDDPYIGLAIVEISASVAVHIICQTGPKEYFENNLIFYHEMIKWKLGEILKEMNKKEEELH